ncbi:MAG: glycosyltransferase [Candidatus Krumholzibacteriia bacterium]
MTNKVCLVGPVHPYRGGIAHFTGLLAAEFARDWQVLVASFTRLYPSVFFPGKTQFDDGGSPPDVESVRVIDSINPFTWWRTARTIARFEPDLVVFTWWHPFFAAAYATITFFAKRRPRARVVFLCHNVLPHESSPLDRILTRLGYAQVNHFLVQSQQDKRDLLRLKPGARVAVRPHPVYDFFNRGRCTREDARKQLAVDGRVILFFGLVRPYKGLRLLIDAFASGVRQLQTTLLIVGEFYEDKQPHLDRIRELSIESHVRVVDRYVPDEEVETYFRACDLVVLPYLSATQSGITQIAYGFDKPVIVTAVGGLPDVVEDGVTGFVVPPRDPDALARAISRFFLENMGEPMQRGVAAARARFSWAACKEALVELSR